MYLYCAIIWSQDELVTTVDTVLCIYDERCNWIRVVFFPFLFLSTEHREKLHGTLATFKEVDSKVIGES